MRFLIAVIVWLFFLTPAQSCADSDAQTIVTTTSGWYGKTQTIVSKVAQSGEINKFAWNLFATFAFTMVAIMVFVAILRGFNWEACIYTALMLFVVSAMMNNYTMVMEAFWAWSNGFAGALQKAVIDGNSGDPMAIGAAITSICDAVNIDPEFTSNPLTLFGTALSAIVVECVAIILGVLATFNSMWAAWGFMVAYMIGFMFIPFVLFERLAWVFDGWLRFTFGFLVYGVVSRANLLLVLIVLCTYFHLPLSLAAPQKVFAFTIENVKDVFGLLCFLLVGILALFSTGAFASTIVSGAAGGGAGRSISQAARTITRVMMFR